MNPPFDFRDHLSEEHLIRFLDGELVKRERATVARHVESCWGCRQRLEQFRAAIHRIVWESLQAM